MDSKRSPLDVLADAAAKAERLPVPQRQHVDIKSLPVAKPIAPPPRVLFRALYTHPGRPDHELVAVLLERGRFSFMWIPSERLAVPRLDPSDLMSHALRVTAAIKAAEWKTGGVDPVTGLQTYEAVGPNWAGRPQQLQCFVDYMRGLLVFGEHGEQKGRLRSTEYVNTVRA